MDRLGATEFKAYLQRYLAFQEILGERLSAEPNLQCMLEVIRQRPGKQLRPRLFFLSARPGDLLDSSVHIAVGIELLHLASITHDDILDRSLRRRGSEALWQSQGARAALLCGDFLFAEAFSEFGRSGMERQLLPVMRTLIAGMVRAELMQNSQCFTWKDSQQFYRRIMRLKTARFFAVSAGLGAMVSGLPHRIIRQVYRFGMLFGMAFQLADDIRDLFTEDLNHGVLSLPALWIGESSARGEKLIKKVCKNKALRAGDELQLKNYLKDSDLLLRFKREILSYLRRAENCLSGMAPWNRMRLQQLLDDMEPYFYTYLSDDWGNREKPEAERR